MRQLRWKAILIRATDLNPRDALQATQNIDFLIYFKDREI